MPHPSSPSSEASYYSYSEYTIAPSEKSVNRRWYDRLDTWRHNIDGRPGLLRKVSGGNGNNGMMGMGMGMGGTGSVMTNPYGGAGDSRSRLGFYGDGEGEEEDVFPKESISSRPSPKRFPSLPLVPTMQQQATYAHRPSPPPPPPPQPMYRQEPVINVAGVAESVPVGMGGAMTGRLNAREYGGGGMNGGGMRASIAGSFDEPPARVVHPGLGLRMGPESDHTFNGHTSRQGIQTPMRSTPVEMRDGTLLVGPQSSKLHPITDPYRLPLPASSAGTFITPPRARPSPGPVPGSLHLPRTAMSRAQMQANGRPAAEMLVMERDLPPLPPSTFADSETGSTVTATPRAGERALPLGRSGSVAGRSSYTASTQPPPIAPKPPVPGHRAPPPPPPPPQFVRATETVTGAVDRLNSILEYPSSEASSQYLDLPDRSAGKKEKENTKYRPPTPYHPPKGMAFSDVDSSVASGTVVGSRKTETGDDSESTIQRVIERNSKIRTATPATGARVDEILEHPQKAERKRYPDAVPSVVNRHSVADDQAMTPRPGDAQFPSQAKPTIDSQPEIARRSTVLEVPGEGGRRSVVLDNGVAEKAQSRLSRLSRHSTVAPHRSSHIPGVSSPLAANVADYQAGATGSRPASVAVSVVSARQAPARSTLEIPSGHHHQPKQSRPASVAPTAHDAASRPVSLHSGSGDSSSDATVRPISAVVAQRDASVQADRDDAQSVASRHSHRALNDHRPARLETVPEQNTVRGREGLGESTRASSRASRAASQSKQRPVDREAAARLTPPDSAGSDRSSGHRRDRAPLERKDSHTSSWVTTHVSDSPRSRRRNLKGGRKVEDSHSSDSDSSSRRRRRRRRSPSPDRRGMMLHSPPALHPMVMNQSMMSPMLSPPLYPPRPPMSLSSGPPPQMLVAAQQAQMMPMMPQGPAIRPHPGPIMSPPASMYGYGWNPGMAQPQQQQQGNYFEAGRPMSAVQMGVSAPINPAMVTRASLSAPPTAFAANYQDPRRSLTGSDPVRSSGMVMMGPPARPERMRRRVRCPFSTIVSVPDQNRADRSARMPGTSGTRPRTGTARLPGAQRMPGSRARRDLRLALPLIVPTAGRMPRQNPQIIDPMARQAGMANMMSRRTTRQPGPSRTRPAVPIARASRPRVPGVGGGGRAKGNIAAAQVPAVAAGQSRGWMRGLLPKKGGS